MKRCRFLQYMLLNPMEVPGSIQIGDQQRSADDQRAHDDRDEVLPCPETLRVSR